MDPFGVIPSDLNLSYLTCRLLVSTLQCKILFMLKGTMQLDCILDINWCNCSYGFGHELVAFRNIYGYKFIAQLLLPGRLIISGLNPIAFQFILVESRWSLLHNQGGWPEVQTTLVTNIVFGYHFSKQRGFFLPWRISCFW